MVDAKVPLTAYLDAVSAPDEASRKAALQRHGQQVAEHVRQLASKQYWNQFQPAPELVVLFLPGDHFFSAALESRPDLIEEALASKVVIATPVTLISVLKGIAYGWNQEQLAENAEEIRRVASEMYERVQLVQEHYSDDRTAVGEDRGSLQPFGGIVGFAPGAGAAQDAGTGCVERRRTGSAGTDRFAGAASAGGERILKL